LSADARNSQRKSSTLTSTTRTTLLNVFNTLTDFKTNIMQNLAQSASNTISKQQETAEVRNEAQVEEQQTRNVVKKTHKNRSKSVENLFSFDRIFFPFDSCFCARSYQVYKMANDIVPHEAKPEVQPRTIYLNYSSIEKEINERISSANTSSKDDSTPALSDRSSTSSANLKSPNTIS
jgi:hypothetical protein